jgi:hypothetical protein
MLYIYMWYEEVITSDKKRISEEMVCLKSQNQSLFKMT